jgi:hypothetical protein
MTWQSNMNEIYWKDNITCELPITKTLWYRGWNMTDVNFFPFDGYWYKHCPCIISDQTRTSSSLAEAIQNPVTSQHMEQISLSCPYNKEIDSDSCYSNLISLWYTTHILINLYMICEAHLKASQNSRILEIN